MQTPVPFINFAPLQNALVRLQESAKKYDAAMRAKLAQGSALSPAAERALAEAAQRRAEAAKAVKAAPKEIGGPAGPEPTRYGDWEKKGLTSDF